MSFILFAIALAVLTPGPANLAIVATSMSRGRFAGSVFALGVQTGSAIWALTAALGLSVWLETVAYGMTAMKIAGGMYLLWLAFKSARSALRADLPDEVTITETSLVAVYMRGALLHLTNPKAVLSWLAVVALIKGTPDVSLWPTLGACILVSSVIFQGYAILFGSAFMLRAYQSARRFIEATLAMVFGYAGTRLLAA